MNRYLIECINDCKNEFVVAYAPSMYDDNMSKAADDYAYELAVSIVDDEFIVTAEGYDYEYMTIDYFGGLEDIKEKLLRTPLPPIVTFDDDPLRILRGIRFSITKRLRVSEDMWQAMKAYDYFDKMPVVSEERIREELTKCFKCNSSLTLGWLSELTDLRDYIFKNTNLWLKPTNEK